MDTLCALTVWFLKNLYLCTMKNYQVSLFTLFVLLFSCSPKNKTEDSQTQQQTTFIQDNEWDDLMKKIDDELPELTHIESLLYYKEDVSSMEAVAYLDQNKLITKIEQESIDGPTGYKTRLHFYSNGGVRFASRHTSIKGLKENAYFSEEITFYAPDGTPTLSKERKSEYEINIESEQFHRIDTVRHSDENAFLVLKQQGPYATTFQGFVESGHFHFLVVGEHTPDNGYTASLSIQEDSPTLRHLRKEGKNALGTELNVEFERYIDPTGYIMQLLKNVRMVEQKRNGKIENAN